MEIVSTKNAPGAIGPYSQAMILNGVVYTSGQVALSPETGEVVGTTIEEQAEQVRQAVEARVDTQIHNFEGYGPEQVQLLKESVTEVRDTCVLFVVSEQAQDVKDSFLKLLYPRFFRP